MTDEELLRHWTTGGVNLSGEDKEAFARLVQELDERYYSEGCSCEERESIKARCMGEASAVAWARQYLARGFPDATTPYLPMFEEIEKVLRSGEVKSVHQVACCSGREVAYFAKRYPEVSFCGSDCDEGLVSFLEEQWEGIPNLRFCLLRMEEGRGERDGEEKCDLLYASGGFHYMDPESLAAFFRRVRGIAGSLFLSQPMDAGYRAEKECNSLGRKMLSWNHPYPYALEKAGWSPVSWREGFVPELPGLKNFAGFAGVLAER